MPSPNHITVNQLARLVGTPAAPTLVDVRIDEDFELDPDLIPGAFRHSHTEPDALLKKLPDRRVVVYCQRGKKLSEGFAALLRCQGLAAETLEGGHIGWRDAGLPRVPATSLPALDDAGCTRWVTRHRPKVDRLACPWLIRRFVDPGARFLFVAPAEVLAVAEKFDATPFDVENVFWSHRGDYCTFDTMLDEFGLTLEPLQRLATIVRAADTNRLDLSPQAPGLLAASLGLSRMYRDDLEMLDAGMGLYDAFYRWARDATGETHDWPQPPGRAGT